MRSAFGVRLRSGLAGAADVVRWSRPLWFGSYGEDSLASAHGFLTRECWTRDDVDGGLSVRLLPDKAHVRFVAAAWYRSRVSGSPLVVLKSRRLQVSWCVTALELWAAGLRPCTYYVACQDYGDSAKMLYRHLWLYTQVRVRNPGWGLGDPEYSLFDGPTMLKRLHLPNGSRFEPLTGHDPDSFRQEGATGVRLEEGAFFPRIDRCWANAQLMCQSAGVGGHPVLVSTNNPESGAWRRLKERVPGC